MIQRIKRSIVLLKEGRLIKQLFFRVKTFFYLLFSRQKNHYFDHMEIQGKSESSFILNYKGKKNFGVRLPLFEVNENNKLILPQNTKRVMIDVGTSVGWINSIEYLNQNPDDSVVIGIEPNIDSWLVSKGIHVFNEKNDIKYVSKFNKNSSSRIIFLPVALSPFEGFAEFNANERMGTSSLLDSAHKTLRKTVVPTMKLSRIIEMVPDNIEYIEVLKIDCEGFDLQVLKSGGEYLSRVVIINIECVNGHLFKNGYTEKEIYDFLEFHNFQEIPNSKKHGTASFVNSKFQQEHTKIKYQVLG